MFMDTTVRTKYWVQRKEKLSAQQVAAIGDFLVQNPAKELELPPWLAAQVAVAPLSVSKCMT